MVAGGFDVNAEHKAMLESRVDYLSVFLFVGMPGGHVVVCDVPAESSYGTLYRLAAAIEAG